MTFESRLYTESDMLLLTLKIRSKSKVADVQILSRKPKNK